MKSFLVVVIANCILITASDTELMQCNFCSEGDELSLIRISNERVRLFDGTIEGGYPEGDETTSDNPETTTIFQDLKLSDNCTKPGQCRSAYGCFSLTLKWRKFDFALFEGIVREGKYLLCLTEFLAKRHSERGLCPMLKLLKSKVLECEYHVCKTALCNSFKGYAMTQSTKQESTTKQDYDGGREDGRYASGRRAQADGRQEEARRYGSHNSKAGATRNESTLSVPFVVVILVFVTILLS